VVLLKITTLIFLIKLSDGFRGYINIISHPTNKQDCPILEGLLVLLPHKSSSGHLTEDIRVWCPASSYWFYVGESCSDKCFSVNTSVLPCL